MLINRCGYFKISFHFCKDGRIFHEGEWEIMNDGDAIVKPLSANNNTAFGPAFGHNMAFGPAFSHNMAFGPTFGHNMAFGQAFGHIMAFGLVFGRL